MEDTCGVTPLPCSLGSLISPSGPWSQMILLYFCSLGLVKKSRRVWGRGCILMAHSKGKMKEHMKSLCCSAWFADLAGSHPPPVCVGGVSRVKVHFLMGHRADCKTSYFLSSHPWIHIFLLKSLVSYEQHLLSLISFF